MKFTKMHGCGNDYIYFNCFETTVSDPSGLAVRLSKRHYSVGGDGIVLICPSEKADAKMRMFNADGSEGRMCGNAIRCVGKFLYDNRIIKKDIISIETLSGIKKLSLHISDGLVETVTVDMGPGVFEANRIPVSLPCERVINYPHNYPCGTYNITCVSMGNPHAVIFTGNINEIELEKVGSVFENDPIFPERVNTEFVEVVGERALKMRVWERGSGETFACGTGACAAVCAAVANGIMPSGEEITVNLTGGCLYIVVTDKTVFMRGSAERVYDGVIAEI